MNCDMICGCGEPLREFSGVKIIRVFNFDNIPHSLYDCYENGWWKITADENYLIYPVTTALGLSGSLRDNSDISNEGVLLDAVREKFGTPDLEDDHYRADPAFL